MLPAIACDEPPPPQIFIFTLSHPGRTGVELKPTGATIRKYKHPPAAASPASNAPKYTAPATATDKPIVLKSIFLIMLVVMYFFTYRPSP
jgi:hypothetical protein